MHDWGIRDIIIYIQKHMACNSNCPTQPFRKYELLTVTIPGRFSLGALGGRRRRRRRRGQEQFHLANVSVLVDGISVFGSHTFSVERVHRRITGTRRFYSHVREDNFYFFVDEWM